jgi:hypothetical protein
VLSWKARHYTGKNELNVCINKVSIFTHVLIRDMLVVPCTNVICIQIHEFPIADLLGAAAKNRINDRVLEEYSRCDSIHRRYLYVL